MGRKRYRQDIPPLAVLTVSRSLSHHVLELDGRVQTIGFENRNYWSHFHAPSRPAHNPTVLPGWVDCDRLYLFRCVTYRSMLHSIASGQMSLGGHPRKE